MSLRGAAHPLLIVALEFVATFGNIGDPLSQDLPFMGAQDLSVPADLVAWNVDANAQVRSKKRVEVGFRVKCAGSPAEWR